jgi:putative addiction module component (TIGR02574 family)
LHFHFVSIIIKTYIKLTVLQNKITNYIYEAAKGYNWWRKSKPEFEINMNTQEIFKEINQLKLEEKIILVGEVWNLIAKENDSIPMPDWQKRELDKRYKEYKSEKIDTFDMVSVHSQIKKSLK